MQNIMQMLEADINGLDLAANHLVRRAVVLTAISSNVILSRNTNYARLTPKMATA